MMTYNINSMVGRVTAVATAALLGSATLMMAQDLRPGRPALPEVALDRAVHGEAAIAALASQLPGVARHYGMTSEKLAERLRKDQDLWVDRQGRLYFAESHLPAPTEAPVVAGGTVQAAALVPLEQTFTLHSRPSATKKIYLDFNGHTTTGTSWTDYTDGDSTFVTPPYDIDGVPSSFSTTELERIQGIWQRVSEDFAPFDVDVTTEDPGVEALRKSTTSDLNYGIRVCIGGASQDWYSPNGYGGVAYIGSFDWSSDTPTYVWENNLGNGNEKYVAEAVSHEVGHTLDLYHDGTSTAGYYSGHGSGADGWAPIMGVGYYQPVVQFSRGEYSGANNTEDDLAKITASYNIPYIADDHGNSSAGATLVPSGSFLVEGLIERNTDVDYFRIDAGAGNIVINIGVDTKSPNLNVEATLFDSLGNIVGFNSPAATLSASLSLGAMPAGTYYLRIDGVGSADPLSTGYSGYGSIGSYSVSGTVPNSGAPTAVASATPTSGLAPLTVQFDSTGSSDPDAGVLTFSWDFGNGQTSTEANPGTVYTTPGTYSAVLTVTDPAGFTASATVVITVQDVPPSAPSALTATAASSTRVDLAWTDNAGNETGFKIERSLNGGAFVQVATVGANVTTYADTGVSGGNSYAYRVRASNAYGDSAYTDPASASTPLPPPAAPTTLAAKVISKTQINLTWRDNANNETGYYVERSLNGTTWTRIATLGANATSYASTGLTANTTYFHRVQAYNASGASAYSNTVSAKTKR
ncbi:MAG: hypothetical protein RJA22_3271 [Verrucomicrobiota bacterium]